MEGFLDLKIDKFKRALFTRAFAIVPALVVAFIGDSDKFNHYLNILQAVQLPFAIIPLLKFNFSEKLMRDKCIKGYKLIILAVMGFFIVFANYYGIYLIQIELSNFQLFLVVCTSSFYFYFMIDIARQELIFTKEKQDSPEQDLELSPNQQSISSNFSEQNNSSKRSVVISSNYFNTDAKHLLESSHDDDSL